MLTILLIKEEFHQIYKEIQLWKADSNKLFFMDKECYEDIIKFYCNHDIMTRFPKITLLSTTMLIFPYSSAQIERLFSQLKISENC